MGFSEASTPSGEMFGYQRLLKLVEDLADQSAAQIAQKMFDTISEFQVNHAQDDDQTLMVIKGVN